MDRLIQLELFVSLMPNPCGCQHKRHVRDLNAQIENHYRVHELDMQQVEQHCQRVKQLEGELHRIKQMRHWKPVSSMPSARKPTSELGAGRQIRHGMGRRFPKPSAGHSNSLKLNRNLRSGSESPVPPCQRFR